MSGALPETERERQLRELAGRLLHWPDPEGPVTADLLPVGYPDALPPEIVDRTELRFLGSVVRPRAGALVGAEMVFEGPGEPEVVVSAYEAALVELGWERVDQPRPMSGGFQFRGFGEMTLLVDTAKSAIIFIQAMDREEGGTELRVRYHPEGAQETIRNMGGDVRHEEMMIPNLKPPPGVKFHPEGMGGAAGDGNPTLGHKPTWRRWSWRRTSQNSSRQPAGAA